MNEPSYTDADLRQLAPRRRRALAVDLVILLVTFGIILPRWETLATWQQVLAWCVMGGVAVWMGWSWWWTTPTTRAWWRR